MLVITEQLSKRAKIENTLKEFSPPNRQEVAFKWNLDSISNPIEFSAMSTEFEHLASNFTLNLEGEQAGEEIEKLRCYLMVSDVEPNIFGK